MFKCTLSAHLYPKDMVNWFPNILFLNLNKKLIWKTFKLKADVSHLIRFARCVVCDRFANSLIFIVSKKPSRVYKKCRCPSSSRQRIWKFNPYLQVSKRTWLAHFFHRKGLAYDAHMGYRWWYPVWIVERVRFLFVFVSVCFHVQP